MRLKFVPGKHQTHIFVVVARRLIFFVVAILVVMLFVIFLFARGSIGDLGPRSSRLARSNEKAAFDAASWRSRDEVKRGEMLADLVRRTPFIGRHRDHVQQLLGPPECYVHYEDEPCYLLKLADRRYFLQFYVNHSKAPGEVLAVKLRPTPN